MLEKLCADVIFYENAIELLAFREKLLYSIKGY